jgi:caffeoyl-CoA O-methyltransferase
MSDTSSRAGARYATPEIMEYVQRTHVGGDDALTRAFAVPADMPPIMVQPSEGRLIHLLARLANAHKIVEVGTLAGYSAIHLARALPAHGHLWTVEFEARHAEVARGNLAAAGLAARATVVVGAGRDVLPTLVGHGPFDVVFIDADKENYDFYGEWALANLRRGGIVLGDNAYLFGELVGGTPRAQAMRRFHERVAAACDSTCIPTPDGLVLGIVR